jgi:hypothetical protein
MPHTPTAELYSVRVHRGGRFLFLSVLFVCSQDLHRFFLPQSVLVWEGTAVQGSDQCRQLFEMLPSSKHTIASFDVQPVTGQQQKQQELERALLPMRPTTNRIGLLDV